MREERRAAPRMPAGSVPALLLLAGTDDSLGCTLRDFSARGARLVFEIPTIVPDRFDLVLPVVGDTYDAEVRWRIGREVGVEFVSDFPRRSQVSAAPVDLGLRVNELEAENARLRQAAGRLARELQRAGGEILRLRGQPEALDLGGGHFGWGAMARLSAVLRRLRGAAVAKS